MNISLGTATWGLLVSIITEVFKFIPWLKANDLTKSLTAIVITAIAAFIANSLIWSWESFVSILVFAFVNYKFLVAPTAKILGLKTQEFVL